MTNRTNCDTSRRTLLSGATAAGVSLLVLPSAAAAASVAPAGTTPAPEPTADFEPRVDKTNGGTIGNETIFLYMGWGETYSSAPFGTPYVTGVTSNPINFTYELVLSSPSNTITGASADGYASRTGVRLDPGATYTLTLTSVEGDFADAGVVRVFSGTR